MKILALILSLLLLIPTMTTGDDEEKIVASEKKEKKVDKDAEKKAILKAEKHFQNGNYREAMTIYAEAALLNPSNLETAYNAITAYANSKQFGKVKDPNEKELPEMGSEYEREKEIVAGICYNLGTAYLKVVAKADKEDQLASKAAELDKSIKWLRKSLITLPGSLDAKSNLELANKLKEKLKKQQEENEEDKEKDKKNKDKKKDDKKDKNKDQEQEDKKKDDQQQQEKKNDQGDEQNKQDQQQQQKKQQPKERQISENMAENLLKAAKDAEKKAMKAMRKKLNEKKRRRSANGRDW